MIGRIERLFAELGAQVRDRSLDVRSLHSSTTTMPSTRSMSSSTLITVLDVVEHMPPEVISQMLIDCFKVS